MASAGVFITVLERLTQEVGPINVQAYMLMSFLWLPTFLIVDRIGPKNNFLDFWRRHVYMLPFPNSVLDSWKSGFISNTCHVQWR